MFDEIWILIPLAPFLLGGLAIWSKHKQKEMELGAKRDPEQEARADARTRALEQRVATLESIVTDSGFNLAKEIETLRSSELDELERLHQKQKVNAK